MRLVPRERWFDFTYVLIDHGRALCTREEAEVRDCPVSDLCPASQA